MQFFSVVFNSFTGKLLNPQMMFHNTASNIICQVLFGTRYDHDDEIIRVIVKCFSENLKIANGPWNTVSLNTFSVIKTLTRKQRRENCSESLYTTSRCLMCSKMWLLLLCYNSRAHYLISLATFDCCINALYFFIIIFQMLLFNCFVFIVLFLFIKVHTPAFPYYIR